MTPPKKRRKHSDATHRKDFRPRRKSRGLPRPKPPPTYNIPESASQSRDPDTPDLPITQLARTNLLLDLIVRRNKNQHRTQPFWKWLSLLRRSTSHLLTLHRQADTTSRDANKPGVVATADATRKLFEAQAEIRSQREVHEEWIREVLVPGCYVAFSTVVADKQFANLGVVLVGVLADVVGVVGVMKRVERVGGGGHGGATAGVKKSVGSARGNGGLDEGRRITAVSTLVTGPDQGEVVERQYESDGQDVAMGAVKRDHGGDEGVVVMRQEAASGSLVEGGLEDSMDVLYDTPMKQPPHLPSSPPNSDREPRRPTRDKELRHKLLTHSIPKSLTSPPQSKKPSTASNSTTTTSKIGTTQTSSSKAPRSPLDTAGPASASTRLDTTSKPKAHKSTASAIAATGLSDAKPKKKKKKGNAIDDLFGGFV